jgi:N-acyl-D-aspartate/D-glutamate deacylase
MLGPDTMVASDAMPLLHDGQPVEDSAWPLPPGTVTHPRTAGTFARTLRRYVREDGTMDLTEAIRRSATLPALALQDMSPAMRRKGRLQVDADADIVAFDLATVTDQATYAESCRVSAGIRHVLVNGVPLISDGRLDTTVLPGRPVRAA